MLKKAPIFRIVSFITLYLITSNLFGQNNSTDTIFIQKDSLLGTSQSIYIDHDHNSKSYDFINNWDFNEFTFDGYAESLALLKINKQTLRNRKPVIPITNWIPLKKYKDSFYVYSPCDLGYHSKISINDTTFIDWGGEGPNASYIIRQNKISNYLFEFEIAGERSKSRKLVINIIDSTNGIAVFQITGDRGNKFQYLMLDDNKIRRFPIIVNRCDTENKLS